MRSFPGAPSTGPRRLALLVAGVVVVGGLVAPDAMAKNDEDDLRDRQHEVQHQIHKAQDDLDEASHRVAAATRHLDRTVTRLHGARKHLQKVRTDLQDARAMQRRLTRRLERAQDRLDHVAERLREAQDEVAAQRDLARKTILGMDTHGTPELAVIGAITSAGSIEDVLIAGTTGTMVLGREDQVLDNLEAAEVALADWKSQVQDARDDVAEQKRAAHQNLERVHALYADARDSRVQVRHLVDRARHARKAAVKAKKHDRAALDRLKDREARIKRQILALANKNPGPTYNGDTGGLLHIPVAGPITSPFGWREHPIYHYWGLHNGTDFGAPCGADLWAAESGTVINEYYDEVYGNRLYLSIGTVNGANITVVYNHMSAYNVSEGAHVARGQVVGKVGETGWATGCHLHFIVMKNGVPVDPMGYL